MQAHYEPPDEGDPLEKFTQNLTAQAKKGSLDPVIGRNEEIRRVMQILARRTKNNPVLLGDPGVGKTAIVEGLAQRIVSGDIPSTLRDKEVLVLDMVSLVAGSSYRGQFENRLKNLMKALEKGSGKYILFMDELHTLVGAGAVGGAMDAANILKPALSRGLLHAIGATTLREYRAHIEKDAALERRFQPVYVDEPGEEDALAILRGLKEKYEIHHGIKITDEALIASVQLSVRFIPDRYLPDKAIDLVDEAASSLKIETESMPEKLDTIKHRITQLEIELASLKREKKDVNKHKSEIENEIAHLKSINKKLLANWKTEKEIIGNLQRTRVGIDQLRLELENAERDALLEKAAELKYGKLPEHEKRLKQLENDWKKIPEEDRLLREEVTDEDIAQVVSRWTGIPLTKLLTSEAEKLVHLEQDLQKRVIGQDEALKKVAAAIRRNRVGIGEAHRPIGSFLFLGPTGVGKTETAKALAESLFNDEKAMIRIDMSEYSESHAVARLIGAPPGYVGYEEGGQLTEAVRRHPYAVILFDEIEKANTLIFNVFLQILDDGRLTDGRGRVVSFKNTILIMTSNLGSDVIDEFAGKDEKEMRAKVLEIVHKSFRPEFINRLDQMVVYRNLKKGVVSQIVELQLQKVSERLGHKNITLQYTQAIKDYLSDVGFDPSYGARPLRRAIQDHILDELALLMIEKKVVKGSDMTVDYKNGKVVISKTE